MKALTSILFAGSILSFSVAHADGFRCESADGNLSVKVYNHTQAKEGTRSAAILVLSNPNAVSGSKTIATFTGGDETLSQSGAEYTAAVNDDTAEGNGFDSEMADGLKLGDLKEILVSVDYNFNEPVQAGEELSGSVTLVKQDGGAKTVELACQRYLKN